MQVNLSFDTENEKLDNLKKLVDALNQLISNREGRPVQQAPSMSTAAASGMPAQIQVQAAPVQQRPQGEQKTNGGCRVIPYEDMSNKMSGIFSGRRY